jgi:hypothetical protein
MSKRQLIILFGVLIIIIALFSGLPVSWNKLLNIIIGLLTIIVAYTTTKSASARKPQSSPYVDIHGKTSAAPTMREPIGDSVRYTEAPKIIPEEPAEEEVVEETPSVSPEQDK